MYFVDERIDEEIGGQTDEEIDEGIHRVQMNK